MRATVKMPCVPRRYRPAGRLRWWSRPRGPRRRSSSGRRRVCEAGGSSRLFRPSGREAGASRGSCGPSRTTAAAWSLPAASPRAIRDRRPPGCSRFALTASAPTSESTGSPSATCTAAAILPLGSGARRRALGLIHCSAEATIAFSGEARRCSASRRGADAGVAQGTTRDVRLQSLRRPNATAEMTTPPRPESRHRV